MFESWDGALTCVQVVRVPIVKGMSSDSMKQAITRTVLTKVWKSQQWLEGSRILPRDFVLFCWIPFAIADMVAEHAHVLMQQVQQHLDPRFSLRLCMPADTSAVFPKMFACKQKRIRGDSRRAVCRRLQELSWQAMNSSLAM